MNPTSPAFQRQEVWNEDLLKVTVAGWGLETSSLRRQMKSMRLQVSLLEHRLMAFVHHCTALQGKKGKRAAQAASAQHVMRRPVGCSILLGLKLILRGLAWPGLARMLLSTCWNAGQAVSPVMMLLAGRI